MVQDTNLLFLVFSSSSVANGTCPSGVVGELGEVAEERGDGEVVLLKYRFMRPSHTALIDMKAG